MANTHNFPVVVVDEGPPVLTLERELASLVGKLMTPELRARVRYLTARSAPGTPVVFLKPLGKVHVGEISASVFAEMTGRPPKSDDLDRVNCMAEGCGHSLCGVCDTHDLPRFQCGCLSTLGVRR